MELFLFAIVVICLLTTPILVKQTFIYGLKITNVVRFNSTVNVSNLSFLFNSSTLCVTAKSGDTLNVFTELLFKTFNKPVIIYDLKNTLITCVRMFILELANSTVRNCEEIIDRYQTTVVYVINNSLTVDFSRSLEACLSVTQSPEVLALSLSDSSLLQLSPVFPLQPRHFVRTSVTEVLQRRVEKCKKLNLQGAALNIGALFYIPFFIYNMETNPQEKEKYDGIHVQLVNEMARQFNFSCTYSIHNEYGLALSNGTWSGGGLGQTLQEGRVDIVATNVWQVPEFYNIMDFGPALNKDKLAFLVLRPEMIDFQWQDVLGIFKTEVWFAILVSFVLTVGMYWTGVNWDYRRRKESWSGCILTLFGFFTSSTSHSRVNESTRFALNSWSVFSLLITTCLSTGIVTRLTIPLYSQRVDTIKQLVEGKHFWTVQFYNNFKNNTSLRESMFDLESPWIKRFEQNYVYMDEDEVAKTAGTDKKMAYVIQTYGTDFVVMETDGLNGHKNLRNYRVSKEAFTEAFVTFGVKKQSILFEPLTHFALLVFQAGLMTHWKEEVIGRWPQYNTKHLLIELDSLTFKEPQGLALFKLQPVFFILIFGSGLASVVFICEIFW